MDGVELLFGIIAINIEDFAFPHELIHDFQAVGLFIGSLEGVVDGCVIDLLDLVDGDDSHAGLIEAEA